MISDSSRVEKGEVVWSDVRGLSRPYPNSCNFSFSSCLDICAGVLGSKPNEGPQNMKNQEVLESFPKEQMFSNVDNQGEETYSYEQQDGRYEVFDS